MINEEELVETEETKEAETKQNRFRSWALWLSVFGLISIVFTSFGVWEKIGIDSATFDGIVTAIGTVLTAFGVVNNPTEKGGL